jgi:hypothetical protein
MRMSAEQTSGNRTILIICLHVVLIGFSVIASAQPVAVVQVPAAGTDAHNIELDKDVRLARTTPIRVTSVTLRDLFRHLSGSRLILVAGRSCADQRVQIQLKNRPLRTLMRALAEMLPATWSPLPDGSGYRLEMTDSAIQRRRRWWQLYEGEWENTRRALRELVLKQMRTAPQAPDPKMVEAQHADMALQLQDMTLIRMFNELPASLQEQIADQPIDFALYSGHSTHGVIEGAVAVPLTQLPDSVRNVVASSQARLMAERGLSEWELTVLFCNMGTDVRVCVLLPNDEINDTRIHTAMPPAPRPDFLPLEHPWIVDRVRKLGSAASPTWKALAAFQASRIWPNEKVHLNGVVIPPPARVEELAAIGATGDMEYVADCYSRVTSPLSEGARSILGAMPGKQALDRIAEEQDCSWKQNSDNVYLMRNNRWYRDDNLQVSDAAIARGLALVQKIYEFAQIRPRPKAPPKTLLRERMEAYGELAQMLTPWQVIHGLAYAPVEEDPSAMKTAVPAGGQSTQVPLTHPESRIRYPLVNLAAELMKEWRLAGFYGSLTPQERDALWDGKLPFQALNPAQQSAAPYLLPTVQDPATSSRLLLGLKPIELRFYVGVNDPVLTLRLVGNQ